MSLYNLLSLLGMIVFIGIAWLLSENKKKVNVRIIITGTLLQLIFGVIIFLVFPNIPEKYNPFLLLNKAVLIISEAASTGTVFLFSHLADAGKAGGFILALQALPSIIFFSALMALLYYTGIMPRIIRLFSSIFSRFMKISGAESLCAASNIFVGIESAFTISPYLDKMTRSELATILTAGMATIASSVLMFYASFFKDVFPTIAAHLISASVLSAPAAIIMSKIIVPETETPITSDGKAVLQYEKENNIFEAIINGSQAGVKLIVGISALLIAVLGLTALTDKGFAGISYVINNLFNSDFQLSLSKICSWIFYIPSLLLGIPAADAGFTAELLGQRLFLTEVPAFSALSAAIKEGILHSPRTAVITAYALCGFAHIASLSIFIGGIGSLIPKRLKTLTQIGLRSLIAATLACLMTGSIAGVLYTHGTHLITK
jgi:CNT family concentrative nucleoside transporter